MNGFEGAILALQQEQQSLEDQIAVTTDRISQVKQAILALRGLSNGGAPTPVRPPLAAQASEPRQQYRAVSPAGRGVRAQVMRALAGGAATVQEISGVTQIHESEVSHAVSGMIGEGFAERIAGGKCQLTESGKPRAAWLISHPHARLYYQPNMEARRKKRRDE